MKQKLPASTVAALLGKIAALDDRKVTPEKAIEFAAAAATAYMIWVSEGAGRP